MLPSMCIPFFLIFPHGNVICSHMMVLISNLGGRAGAVNAIDS